MAVLIYKDSGGRYVDFQVPMGKTKLGRSDEADLPIHDPLISRFHCEIRHNLGEFVIQDLESKNGTFVNEKKIKEAKLKVGDKIRIGHTVIAFDA